MISIKKEKNIIEKTLIKILSQCCELYVYGYDIIEDKYWGKKIKVTNNKIHCILQFTLSIETCNENSNKSYIHIHPMFGTSSDIKIFEMDLLESLQLYETSNFFKNSIDNSY